MEMVKKNEQYFYVSPLAETVDITAEDIICLSGNIDNFNVLDDDTDNWA